MKQFAYIRVSTKDQHVDRQLMALEPYNIPKKNIYCDYQSGKDFERPAYRKMIRRIKQGDLLIIKSIDRLGRNYNDILVQWQYITKEIGADILVLDMLLLDTREKDGNLTGTLIADLVLQILAYVAQTERDFIRQRQAEGIAAAKAKGKKFGRKPIEMPCEFVEIHKAWQRGNLSAEAAAEKLQISRSTFYRRCKEYLEEK
jgi:DNA invertase Pin-like site-specific DNA recombinase